MNATITVVCYKSKVLSNGESPLMLRICKDGKKKYQSLGISVATKFWDFKKNKPKSSCPNKEYIQKIISDKYIELRQRMLELNSEQKEYTTSTLLIDDRKRLQLKTVNEFYQNLIQRYEIENKCGNRLIYKYSYNSLNTFAKGKLDILFSAIDVPWLLWYENEFTGSRSNKRNNNESNASNFTQHI